MTILINTDVNRQLQTAVQALIAAPKLLCSLRSLLRRNVKLQKQLSEKIPAFSAPSKTTNTACKAPWLESKQSASPSKPVRVCQLSEYKQVALSLANAFADDPCALWLINTQDCQHWSAQQRWALHLEIMEYMVYLHMIDGIVTTVGEDYGAVALWMPPGKDNSSWSSFRSGVWRLHYRLSKLGRHRFFNDFMPMLHDVKHDVLAERNANSWYLVYLGTRSEARRQGLARSLVEDVVAQADRDGLPMYLECSKQLNVPIYEKFGFHERTKLWFGTQGDQDTLPLNIMVREPMSC